MSEWSNEHDWKSCDVNSIHGFKSHSLRHSVATRLIGRVVLNKNNHKFIGFPQKSLIFKGKGTMEQEAYVCEKQTSNSDNCDVVAPCPFHKPVEAGALYV